MTKMMIRVDAEISDELSSAFPHLTARLVVIAVGYLTLDRDGELVARSQFVAHGQDRPLEGNAALTVIPAIQIAVAR